MADATPIHKFISFEPERVRTIIDAFDDACRSLAQPVPDDVRSALAKRITELAQFGEWSRERLRDEAVAYVETLNRD